MLIIANPAPQEDSSPPQESQSRKPKRNDSFFIPESLVLLIFLLMTSRNRKRILPHPCAPMLKSTHTTDFVHKQTVMLPNTCKFLFCFFVVQCLFLLKEICLYFCYLDAIYWSNRSVTVVTTFSFFSMDLLTGEINSMRSRYKGRRIKSYFIIYSVNCLQWRRVNCPSYNVQLWSRTNI